ncbi:MAG: VanW family protein [Clostridia bacterium]|nr:VanW family protein [Clostridia bacterium]
MLRRLLAFALAFMMIFSVACAEETEEEELSDSQMEELLAEDAVSESDEDAAAADESSDKVYHEKNLSDFTMSSPALYTCKVTSNTILYAERNVKSKALVYCGSKNVTVEVLYVGANWTICRYDGAIGYVKRKRLLNVTPVDPVNTPPYGAQKSTYIATTATECHVRKSMDNSADSWVVLNPGTMLSIWQLQNGWAIVPYWRTYGYINMNELTDLIPVSETDNPARKDSPIAAYTSYYTMVQTDINKGRIINIRVACDRLTRVMQPGEILDFNAHVGPYRKALGYQPAWVLINGTSVPGYGGGTCQVSSTLYNALLQLPGIGILQRRPHGADGAKYLPHGVDAAVGNDKLNLRFRNNYDFPIRVEGHTSDDGALLMLIYRAD